MCPLTSLIDKRIYVPPRIICPFSGHQLRQKFNLSPISACRSTNPAIEEDAKHPRRIDEFIYWVYCVSSSIPPCHKKSDYGDDVTLSAVYGDVASRVCALINRVYMIKTFNPFPVALHATHCPAHPLYSLVFILHTGHNFSVSPWCEQHEHVSNLMFQGLNKMLH